MSNRPDEPVEHVDEHAAHAMRARNLRVVGIEEDDEHAGPRIAGHLTALLDGVRLDAEFLRDPGPDSDVLEGLDLLRHAVFQDAEVLRPQAGHEKQAAARPDGGGGSHGQPREGKASF